MWNGGNRVRWGVLGWALPLALIFGACGAEEGGNDLTPPEQSSPFDEGEPTPTPTGDDDTAAGGSPSPADQTPDAETPGAETPDARTPGMTPDASPTQSPGETPDAETPDARTPGVTPDASPAPTPDETPVAGTPDAQTPGVTPDASPTPSPDETPDAGTPDTGTPETTPDAATPPVPTPTDDLDGDGVPSARDCDDTDPAVYPGAEEVCDGIDNNCDALVDETGGEPYFSDADGDGARGVEVVTEACVPDDGLLPETAAIDCDDSDSSRYPGAEEICDGVDNDCDEAVDEGVLLTWYLDVDGDGFGDESSQAQACVTPQYHVADAGDCDDSNSEVYPGAPEICDGADNNCDGTTDEGLISLWYLDADGDGWGMGTPVEACEAPTSVYVAQDGDCNDFQSSINPDAIELCDGVDNDCDGSVDQNSADTLTFYLDADGDGFGVSSDTLVACQVPEGYAYQAGDCDDGLDTVNPDAEELCNGIDDNCNGIVDTDADQPPTWYLDSDADGYGRDEGADTQCNAPSDFYVTQGGDCDDLNPDLNPGELEVCDGVDNDCDGTVDIEAEDGQTWYADRDGDGHGDDTSSYFGCTPPDGFVSDNTDCNDAHDDVYPGAIEQDNDRDDDCNGLVDDFPVDCAELLVRAPTAGSGFYLIEPIVDSTPTLLDVYCDNELDGGGWTVVYANIAGDAGIRPYEPEAYGVTPVGDAYKLSGAQIAALASGGETLFIRQNAPDQWLRVEAPFFSEAVWPTHRHLTTTIQSASGEAATAVVGYNDQNSVNGGWLGVTSEGPDHHNPGYYELNGSCSNHFVYTYGDNFFGVNTALGSGWPSTTECDSSGSEAPGMMVGVRACPEGHCTPDPAVDCQAHLRADPSLPSGYYQINPDGQEVFEVYCDMERAGGGWTYVWASNQGDAGTPPYEVAQDTRLNPWRNKYALAYEHLLRLEQSEHIFIRRSDVNQWLTVGAPFFSAEVWPTHVHLEDVPIMGSEGDEAMAILGYSDTNSSGGGWYGLTSSGPDHHSTNYYELNAECANQYVYTYGGNYFAANTALGSGWPETTSCSSSSDANQATVVGIR